MLKFRNWLFLSYASRMRLIDNRLRWMFFVKLSSVHSC
jgi:hypothetical protein